VATKKKKTAASRTGTAGKKAGAKRAAARKKSAAGSTRRSTAASKKTKKTAKKSAGKTTRKKSAARKSAAKKKVKKTAKKKTARKSAKSTGKKTAKKKTKTKTKKKSALKKSASKKSSKKKTSKKKTAGKKTSKKSSGKAASKAGSSDSAASSKNKNKRTQSVVEAASGASADKQGYVFINGRRVRMISTQGKNIPRKPTKSPAPQVNPDEAVSVKPGKSNLSKKELRHYRDLLLIKRAELVGDLSAMEAEALRSNVGEVSHMPIHMADIGSDVYDQDFRLGMAETERKQIREIDDALMRIKDGTYGICQMTGEPIPKARLDAKPWAKYTIEAARKLEGHWQSR